MFNYRHYKQQKNSQQWYLKPHQANQEYSKEYIQGICIPLSILEIKGYMHASEVPVSKNTPPNSPNRRCTLNFCYDLEMQATPLVQAFSTTVRELPTLLVLFKIILYIDVSMTWQLITDAFLTKCMLDQTVQAANWKIVCCASTDSLMA